MKTRIISGLLMLPLLGLVFLGGYFLLAGVVLLTIFALREFIVAFGEQKRRLLPLFVGGIFYIAFFIPHIALIDFKYAQPFELGGVLSVSGLHSFLWLAILSAFGTDIFAYFTGMAIGKHKLCPNISPKKTVEGAIGGAVGSMLLCGVFGYFFLPDAFIDSLVLGALGGVVSQAGDLTASAVKRKLGIKDWGNVIPGHGGILDRVDSLILTAPLVFYYLTIETALFGVG